MKSVMCKEIIIIDAFISNKTNENQLSNFIDRIKLTKIPIFLISNSVISQEIVKKVDFFLYDSNNRLFDDIFDSYEKFILWNKLDNIKFNTVYYHKQKHALSVVINLLNSLKFINNLNFTHFHRIEYDTLIGDETISIIENISSRIQSQDKKGYYILNHQNKSHTFQYFFSEINNFLKIIPDIKNQEDYINYIEEKYNNKNFIILEKLMYDLICNNHNDFIIVDIKDFEFSDSLWNTVNSTAHIEDRYKNSITYVYNGTHNNLILSKNNSNIVCEREIILYDKKNNLIDNFHHVLNGENSYMYHEIDKTINKILIKERGQIIDIIDVEKVENYFEIID